MWRFSSKIFLCTMVFGSCNSDNPSSSAGSPDVPPASEPARQAVVTGIPPLPELDVLKRELAKQNKWEGRWHRVNVTWVDHGEIGVLISFPEEGGKAAEENYEALRERWPEFIESAVAAVQDLIAEYDHEEYGPDPESDVFEFEIPGQPMAEKPEWTFHINSEPAWVVDLVGWEIVGGQGVF